MNRVFLTTNTVTSTGTILSEKYYDDGCITGIDPLDEIKTRLEKLEKVPRKIEYTMLSCRNCGASLQQKVDDYIVKCQYCGTAYMIGTYQINSR